MELSIYAELARNPDAYLLGPFTAADSKMEPLCVYKTIYLPAPFGGIFLERYLKPAEAWNRLRGAIVDGGQEVDCRQIIDWLCVAPTKKVGDDKSTLALPRPTAILSDRDLLHHRHQMLTRHLSRLDPALQRVHESLIAIHIREVAV